MNYLRIILVSCCSLSMLSSLTLAETEQDEAGDTITYGRWVRDGEAITNPPVCYQLWRCESSKQEVSMLKLPKGEWGLCENYLTLNPDNVCLQCDAPPPTEVCY